MKWSIKQLTLAWLCAIMLTSIFSSKAVHAQDMWKERWLAYQTTKGCIFYQWNDTQTKEMGERLEREARNEFARNEFSTQYSWSGPCKSGEAITGKGTLTITNKFPNGDIGIGKITQTMIKGAFHGSGRIENSNYPDNPLTNVYQYGCLVMDDGGVGSCKPRGPGDKSATNTTPQTVSKNSRYGALAIDKAQGNTYGWAVDYASLAEARAESVAQCNKVSASPCEMVLEFGNTCASYAIDAARGSTAYGWDHAPTRAQADAAALKYCTERGGSGSKCLLRVWGCTGNAAQSAKK